MVEFLWTDPEEDYQIDDLPDAASSAPTAAQWISMHKDLQTRAAWRNTRDERVLKKVTEQTAIATKIAEENKRFMAEKNAEKRGRGTLRTRAEYMSRMRKKHMGFDDFGHLRCMWHVESFMGRKEGERRQKEGEFKRTVRPRAENMSRMQKKYMGFADFGHLRCMWHVESL